MGKPFDWMNFKQDNREPRGGWAAGWYTCKCNKCGDSYMGAKRSWHCADCAYLETPIQSALSEIGIEKPSDVSMVLERAREMMEVSNSIKFALIAANSKNAPQNNVVSEIPQIAEEQARMADTMKRLRDYFEMRSNLSHLIAASSTLVEEMKAMGYGETSDRPLPGAWDGFVEALERAKG